MEVENKGIGNGNKTTIDRRTTLTIQIARQRQFIDWSEAPAAKLDAEVDRLDTYAPMWASISWDLQIERAGASIHHFSLPNILEDE